MIENKINEFHLVADQNSKDIVDQVTILESVKSHDLSFYAALFNPSIDRNIYGVIKIMGENHKSENESELSLNGIISSGNPPFHITISDFPIGKDDTIKAALYLYEKLDNGEPSLLDSQNTYFTLIKEQD
ncbi:hypothetical protein [Latilactobacillus curvatus]